jgi:hypothetical protein
MVNNKEIREILEAVRVFEYSVSQCCFHIESLSDLVKTGMEGIAYDSSSDFYPIAIFVDEERYLKLYQRIMIRVMRFHLKHTKDKDKINKLKKFIQSIKDELNGSDKL